MTGLELLQSVVLTREVEGTFESCLIPAGTHGVIVDIASIEHAEAQVGVELFDDEGETIDVAFIPESYVRPATEAEMAASMELTRRLNADPLIEP